MNFLETEHLILRKVQEPDYEAYFRGYIMDKEMDQLMCRSGADSEADARLSFEWFLYKEERAYVLVHRDTGQVIGNLTVYNRVPASISGRAEVSGKAGRSLSFAMSPAWQRKGLMLEAVTGVIRYLFQSENVDYIHCGYLSFNKASKSFQQKLGFVCLATESFHMGSSEITSVENILWRRGSEHGILHDPTAPRL